MNIIGKKYIWFVISLAIMIPGIIALFVFGLNLSVEFTGGSKMSISFPQQVTEKEVKILRSNFESEKIELVTIVSLEKQAEAWNKLKYTHQSCLSEYKSKKYITTLSVTKDLISFHAVNGILCFSFKVHITS